VFAAGRGVHGEWIVATGFARWHSARPG
jgi:hypothetical protein